MNETIFLGNEKQHFWEETNENGNHFTKKNLFYTMFSEEIHVILIEDDVLWQQALTQSLTDFGFTVAGAASSFETGVALLNNTNFDIALLDIDLNGKATGIELGKMLHNLYKKPFIFITGSSEKHSLTQAADTNPSGYLTKPFNPASLFVTIHGAIANYSNINIPVPNTNNDDSFFVKQGSAYKKIDWKNVLSLTSEKNYTAIYNSVDAKTYYIRSTLPKTLKFIIPTHLQKQFVQVNRAQAVNLQFIDSITGKEVFTNLQSFLVTDNFENELKQKLQLIR